jgi:hypothetical protein
MGAGVWWPACRWRAGERGGALPQVPDLRRLHRHARPGAGDGARGAAAASAAGSGAVEPGVNPTRATLIEFTRALVLPSWLLWNTGPGHSPRPGPFLSTIRSGSLACASTADLLFWRLWSFCSPALAALRPLMGVACPADQLGSSTTPSQPEQSRPRPRSVGTASARSLGWSARAPRGDAPQCEAGGLTHRLMRWGARRSGVSRELAEEGRRSCPLLASLVELGPRVCRQRPPRRRFAAACGTVKGCGPRSATVACRSYLFHLRLLVEDLLDRQLRSTPISTRAVSGLRPITTRSGPR